MKCKIIKIKLESLLEHYNSKLLLCESAIKEDKADRKENIKIGKIFEIDTLNKDLISIKAEKKTYISYIEDIKDLLKLF